MATRGLSHALRSEYDRLFDTCVIDASREREVDRYAASIVTDRARYDQVARAVGVPWQLVGVIHLMEASRSFAKHLHNGDPLTARTRRVPTGRRTSDAVKKVTGNYLAGDPRGRA